MLNKLKIDITNLPCQSPGVFAWTPALPVVISEGRITNWRSAPSVGATTHNVNNVNKHSPDVQYVWFGWHWGRGRFLIGTGVN